MAQQSAEGQSNAGRREGFPRPVTGFLSFPFLFLFFLCHFAVLTDLFEAPRWLGLQRIRLTLFDNQGEGYFFKKNLFKDPVGLALNRM